jgi:hypothetical protein
MRKCNPSSWPPAPPLSHTTSKPAPCIPTPHRLPAMPPPAHPHPHPHRHKPSSPQPSSTTTRRAVKKTIAYLRRNRWVLVKVDPSSKRFRVTVSKESQKLVDGKSVRRCAGACGLRVCMGGCAVLCCAVLCCAVLCCAVLCALCECPCGILLCSCPPGLQVAVGVGCTWEQCCAVVGLLRGEHR